MLRRLVVSRKKVMGLYRLLGNKADVIKGFAKRCNEQWEIAPRSEIGLYLGDIQDHILTMTGNLSHYETFVDDCFCCSVGGDIDMTTQVTFEGSFKLPRPDQHSYERTPRADRRCAGETDCTWYHRSADEHHHWHVGHERAGSGARCPESVLVLVE